MSAGGTSLGAFQSSARPGSLPCVSGGGGGGLRCIFSALSRPETYFSGVCWKFLRGIAATFGVKKLVSFKNITI